MKLLLIAAVVSLAVPHVVAAEKRSVTKRIAAGAGFATNVELAQHIHLGSRSSFRSAETAPTAKGNQRRRLRQTYDGLDIIGADADVEVNAQGLMMGAVTGTLAYSLENDIGDTSACTHTQAELLDKARQYLEVNHVISPNNIVAPAVSAMQKQIFQDDDGSAKLVYKLDFMLDVQPTPVRPFFIFDACDPDLRVVIYFNKIKNMTIPMANRRQAEEQCDTTTSAPQITGQPGGYEDGINGAYGVANDAFHFGTIAGTLYPDWYNMEALTFTPKFYVHYRSEYENAFWDGSRMTFGDGRNTFHPLVNQDVIAHELAHGITDRLSDLYYGGESGGINEAFSDMSGEAAEEFGRGSNDWKVGAEIFKANGALRYFEDPTQDGRSIGHISDYTSGMDVHYSSGIFNRAFYQLVAVQGVPIRQTYEMFLMANRLIWAERTGFQDGACGVMKAAYDLGYSVTKVRNAFNVVGIDLTSCDYQSFQQGVTSGETRQGVTVSSIRNPVFALELSLGSTAVIDVYSPDSDEEVTITISSDAAGDNVVANGVAPMDITVSQDTAYFQLSTPSGSDVSYEVTVDTY